jgi:hypothetical protein
VRILLWRCYEYLRYYCATALRRGARCLKREENRAASGKVKAVASSCIQTFAFRICALRHEHLCAPQKYTRSRRPDVGVWRAWRRRRGAKRQRRAPSGSRARTGDVGVWRAWRSPQLARPLVARRRSSYADRMTLWHALTHIGARRPQTAPTCPAWIGHHPLPVASGPLLVAPITLHCGYWLNAPQPLLNHHIVMCAVSYTRVMCNKNP